MAQDWVVRMDAAALNAFLTRAFPHTQRGGVAEVERVAPGAVWTFLNPTEAHLRPGGIVSGPTLMAMTDTAAYALVLAHIGEVAMAVTSSLHYNFLRPCPQETVRAHASFIKLGRRQAVIDVRLHVDSLTGPVGQAVVTYAIPAG